jgi:hypothetical protein
MRSVLEDESPPIAADAEEKTGRIATRKQPGRESIARAMERSAIRNNRARRAGSPQPTPRNSMPNASR